MQIKCIQIRPEESFHIPTRGYIDDAGFDLYISRACIIHPKTFAQIPTNCALAIPDGYWGLVLGRSSTFFKKHLMCHQGTIDPGYRGEIMGLVYNPTSKKVSLFTGERIFQVIFMPLTHNMAVRSVKKVGHEKFPKGSRGGKGLGSTGGML